MKKIITSLFVASLLTSCLNQEDFASENVDPKKPAEVPAQMLFTSAQKSFVDQITSTNVNNNIYRLMSQYWTQTTYTDESNYDLQGRTIPQSHWSEMYRDVLYDLKDAKQKVASTEVTSAYTQADKDSQLAQIEIFEILGWSNLVDSFGDIPYTQALDGGSFPLPAYDNDTEIYADLFARLDSAITLLATGGTGFSTDDKVYAGNNTAWLKFANSIKLRMAMRLADVDAANSVKFANEAIAAGVFESNADNANFAYGTTSQDANTLWYDLVQSGRNDFIASNTMVDIMNTMNDPRRGNYFEMHEGAFVGGTYGQNSSYSNYSHVSETFKQADLEGVVLDYSEVAFHLAEAAARGGYSVSGAEAYYKAGVSASVIAWGGTQADADTYLAADATYDAANWKESIGTQAWLAAYNSPFAGWSAQRKFDFPVLNTAATSGLPSPRRYTYPINEQNLNNTNREAAATAIGGDAQATKVFWDAQ